MRNQQRLVLGAPAAAAGSSLGGFSHPRDLVRTVAARRRGGGSPPILALLREQNQLLRQGRPETSTC
jgi:hypothetical protein